MGGAGSKNHMMSQSVATHYVTQNLWTCLSRTHVSGPLQTYQVEISWSEPQIYSKEQTKLPLDVYAQGSLRSPRSVVFRVLHRQQQRHRLELVRNANALAPTQTSGTGNFGGGLPQSLSNEPGGDAGSCQS